MQRLLLPRLLPLAHFLRLGTLEAQNSAASLGLGSLDLLIAAFAVSCSSYK